MGDIGNFEFDYDIDFFTQNIDRPISIFFDISKLISMLPLIIHISSLVDISIDFIEKRCFFLFRAVQII